MNHSKGRILKIKTGYNPNSSSIGTHVSYFIKGMSAFAVLINGIMAVLYTFREKRKKK